MAIKRKEYSYPRIDLLTKTYKYEDYEEQKLMLSMIQLAIDDCYSSNYSNRGSALAYVFNKQIEDYSYSFDNLCLSLDLNPSAIRRYISKTKDKMVLRHKQKRTVKDYKFEYVDV